MSETLGKKCSWRTFDSELVAKRRFKSTCFFCGAVMCSSHSLYGNIHVQFWDGKCFRLHHRNSQKGAKIIYTAISFLHLILFCPTDWLNRKKNDQKRSIHVLGVFLTFHPPCRSHAAAYKSRSDDTHICGKLLLDNDHVLGFLLPFRGEVGKTREVVSKSLYMVDNKTSFNHQLKTRGFPLSSKSKRCLTSWV